MIVGSLLNISIEELSPQEWRKVEKALTFAKPNGDVVQCYRKQVFKGNYILPRGAWSVLPDHIRYTDKRTRPKLPVLDFSLSLDAVEIDPRFNGQIDAVKSMLEEEQGLVIRPPGTGKTQIVLAFAAICQTRVLVLVHTEDILKQWIEYAEKAIPELKGKIGVIQGKTCKIEQITVATVQTLNRSYIDKGPKWWAQWGALIADEAHHVSAPTWEAVINTCPAYFRFGFTASPTRADGLHPSMRFIIGPVIHRQKFTSAVSLKVVPKTTDFRMHYRGPFDWGPLLNKLVADESRNTEIAIVAEEEVAEGNSVLILSRRIEHLQNIAATLECDSEILAAAICTKAERKRILADFKSGKLKCLLATQLADEALDVPMLNRIILTHPGKAEGRLIQQVGRAIRMYPGKKDAVIYDFVDRKVGVLRRQWNERKRVYAKEKISVESRGVLQWR